jgi:hypothetical protein
MDRKDSPLTAGKDDPPCSDNEGDNTTTVGKEVDHFYGKKVRETPRIAVGEFIDA